MVTVIKIEDPKIKCDTTKVYSPSDDSFLIIDYFRKVIDEESFDGIKLAYINNILDIGTGTGIIAIFFELIKRVLSNFTPKIFASDILIEAIQCAKLNEKLNYKNNQIEFILSDLFDSFPDSLKHSFEIVTFNPPYLPSIENIEKMGTKKRFDVNWDGGQKGYEVLIKFFDKVMEYLNLKRPCRVYYVCSNRTNIKQLNSSIEKKGFKIVKLAKKHIFFEDIILNRAEIL